MLVHTSPDILKMAELGGYVAQLDDMAQMLGRRIQSVENDPDAILHALNKSDAVLVKDVGCVILTEVKEDAGALAMLLNKAAIAKNYTLACGVYTQLSAFDCCLMRNVYKMKYSKKKEG